VGTICWKCGMEVPAGAQACGACGAAVAGTGGQAAQPFTPAPFGTPAATPGQGYSSPPPPPSASYQPVAPAAPPAFSSSTPPPQPGFAPVQQGYAPAPPMIPPGGPPVAQPAAGGGGGSTALKIILIIVAVFVFIVILIVGIIGYIGYRAVHAVREAAHGNSITLPGSSGGTFSVNANKTYSAAELGTDVYPGATASRGGMKMDLPTGTMVTGIFVTSDSKDQVVAFYKDKLGASSGLMESDDAAVLSLKRSDKDSVMVTVSNKANENDGKTKIAIVHTTSK